MIESTASPPRAAVPRPRAAEPRVRRGDVGRLMESYPKIFFACHTRHVRDPKTAEEVSSHQASILDHLDCQTGTGLVELAEHMGVTPSTMSLNVDRLERRGYVVRERDGVDRRRVLLRLTEAGSRITEASSVLDSARVRELLAELSPPRREAALAGLELLAKAAHQAMRKRAKRGKRQPAWGETPPRT